MACANNAPPLLLPWTNVTVSKDGNAVARGIELGVGTPNQIFSLRPSIGDVNTWLFNMATCGSASNDSCIGFEGGAYDPQASSTYQLTTQARWNGSQSANEQGSFIYFNDDINFGQNGTAYGYPMFLDQPGQGTQGGLPLGRGSSFLEVAVNTNAAPSQEWGLWTGSRSIENPVDGLLVIGGYDTTRVDGDFTTFGTSLKCPTCVLVTNITYNSVSGSSSLFSNSSETLEVALEPFERSLELPQDIFDNFAHISQGTWNDSLGALTYPRANPPDGNLTITLLNGYTTVIPASELFSISRLYDSSGVYSIFDPDSMIAEVDNYTDPQYVPSWGIPFLTMNYMVMDYEKDTFQMAPAIRTDLSSEGGPLIKALCTGVVSSSTSSPTHTPTAQPTAPTSVAPIARHNHIGAIVGGVVGGVAGLALIAIVILFILSRRKKEPAARGRAIAQEHISEKDKASRLSMTTDATPTDVTELPSPQQGYTTMNHWLSTQMAGEEVRILGTLPFPGEANSA